jgi:hypothetical protein
MWGSEALMLSRRNSERTGPTTSPGCSGGQPASPQKVWNLPVASCSIDLYHRTGVRLCQGVSTGVGWAWSRNQPEMDQEGTRKATGNGPGRDQEGNTLKALLWLIDRLAVRESKGDSQRAGEQHRLMARTWALTISLYGWVLADCSSWP